MLGAPRDPALLLRVGTITLIRRLVDKKVMDFGYRNDNVVEEEEHDIVEEEEDDDFEPTYTEDEQDEPAQYARLSVKELRRRLKEKGLRVAGAKAELVQRLLHPEKETPSQIKNGIAHDVLTADYILRVGLVWVGIGEDRQKVKVASSITRFKSFYGVEPRTIKDAYQSFVDHSDEDDTSLKEFMMLIEWLKKCKSL